MDKKEYIRQMAVFLTNTTMNVKELAGLLNWNFHRTDSIKKYSGGRGTYKLLHFTYDGLVSIGYQGDADKVAVAFQKPDGTYAYNK